MNLVCINSSLPAIDGISLNKKLCSQLSSILGSQSFRDVRGRDLKLKVDDLNGLYDIHVYDANKEVGRAGLRL